MYIISAKTDEDYSHYCITCIFLNEFWKHIVLGYKTDDKNDLALNVLSTVV